MFCNRDLLSSKWFVYYSFTILYLDITSYCPSWISPNFRVQSLKCGLKIGCFNQLTIFHTAISIWQSDSVWEACRFIIKVCGKFLLKKGNIKIKYFEIFCERWSFSRFMGDDFSVPVCSFQWFFYCSLTNPNIASATSVNLNFFIRLEFWDCSFEFTRAKVR